VSIGCTWQQGPGPKPYRDTSPDPGTIAPSVEPIGSPRSPPGSGRPPWVTRWQMRKVRSSLSPSSRMPPPSQKSSKTAVPSGSRGEHTAQEAHRGRRRPSAKISVVARSCRGWRCRCRVQWARTQAKLSRVGSWKAGITTLTSVKEPAGVVPRSTRIRRRTRNHGTTLAPQANRALRMSPKCPILVGRQGLEPWTR
jgi:hypothetical protein